MSEGNYNRNNVGQLSLDKFVELIPGIYAEKDAFRSVWDVWLHATHHAAAIGEEVRKYRPGQTLLIEIADFAMWLFTFTGKINGSFLSSEEAKSKNIEELTIRTQMSLSDIIWSKYPKICPVCFWRRADKGKLPKESLSTLMIKPCDCLIFNVEDRDKAATPEEKAKKHKEKLSRVNLLRDYAREHKKDKPESLDDWQEQFRVMYEANLMHLSFNDIAFHLLEEVGEVSDAMVRMYTYNNDLGKMPMENQIWLEEEIADVFSWLLALVNALQIMPDITKEFFAYQKIDKTVLTIGGDIRLSKIIWFRYGSDETHQFWCPTCFQPKCTCNISFVGKNETYDNFLEHIKISPFN